MSSIENKYGLSDQLFKRAIEFIGEPQGLVGQAYRDLDPRKQIYEQRLAMLLAGVAAPFIHAGILAINVFDKHAKEVGPYVNIEIKNPYSGKREGWQKLRTMVPNANQLNGDKVNGVTAHRAKHLGHKDPRVTGIGNLLRLSSIDELPKLRQAAKGEVSLVGYHYFSQAEWTEIQEHENEMPYAGFVEQVRRGFQPGLISLYGVMGRKRLTPEDRIKLEWMLAENEHFGMIKNLTIGAMKAVLDYKTAG